MLELDPDASKMIRDLRQSIDNAPIKNYDIERFFDREGSPLRPPSYRPSTHDSVPFPTDGPLLLAQYRPTNMWYCWRGKLMGCLSIHREPCPRLPMAFCVCQCGRLQSFPLLSQQPHAYGHHSGKPLQPHGCQGLLLLLTKNFVLCHPHHRHAFVVMSRILEAGWGLIRKKESLTYVIWGSIWSHVTMTM